MAGKYGSYSRVRICIFTAFKVRVFCSKQTVESELTTSIYLIRAHVANAKTRSNMSEAAAAPAKKKAAPKAKKPSDHPKYEVMIASAIDNLKSRKGSSRAAIKKHIEANYKVSDNANVHLKLALKRGVSNGVFTQVKGAGANGSFKNAQKTKPAKKVAKKPAKSPKKAKKPAAKKAVVKKVTAKPAAKSPKKAKKPAAKKPAAKKAAVKKTPKKGGKKAKK